MDGWLTLLVGMKVPHRKPHTPRPAEAQTWEEIQRRIRERAQRAFTVPEVLALVRSPRWKWNPNAFPS